MTRSKKRLCAVTRTWYVQAADSNEAIEATRDTPHDVLYVHQLTEEEEDAVRHELA